MLCRTAALLCLIALLGFVAPAAASDRAALEADARTSLKTLVASQPYTEDMLNRAAGVLVFPDILKAGLLLGGAAGEGVLFINNEAHSYYQSHAASFGLQAGVAKFGYVMLFMDQAALDFAVASEGWEVGVGPNVTVADEGFAKKLSTTTTQEGIFVFFLDQEGLFAGAGIEGTKISKAE
ncbi:MAG: YSC84-related protein [Pseudomonadota bacterium]